MRRIPYLDEVDMMLISRSNKRPHKLGVVFVPFATLIMYGPCPIFDPVGSYRNNKPAQLGF